MIELADQLFVVVKHEILALLPVSIQPVASVMLTIGPIVGVFATLFALTTILERKGLGRIQNRYGPNRVGPCGILQPLADGIKAIIKEDVVPFRTDRVLHFIAPVIVMAAALLAYSVLPFGRNMVALDLDAGVLFFFAVGASTELAIFMAGWSCRNKYALLGAMRAIAQMISYEIPLILSPVGVLMVTGTLSTVRIVEAQQGYTGLLPHWHVLTPWGFAGFLLFLVAATAEANRSPFDLPEGESEIVAGYFTEYSGFKFAMFFFGEYLGLFAAHAMAITLFLGGWTSPLEILDWVPSYAWFFAKLLALICLSIWVRGTMPRLRADQLMNFAWKFMLPMSLVNLVAAGIWKFTHGGPLGWLICGAMVAIAYVWLGSNLATGTPPSKRQYRFAD